MYNLSLLTSVEHNRSDSQTMIGNDVGGCQGQMKYLSVINGILIAVASIIF